MLQKTEPRPWACKDCIHARDRKRNMQLHLATCALNGRQYGNILRCPYHNNRPTPDEPETFAEVLGILRHAAAGDFDGATGMVTENFMILLGRGLGDSYAAAFEEYADRLQTAHEREVSFA